MPSIRCDTAGSPCLVPATCRCVLHNWEPDERVPDESSGLRNCATVIGNRLRQRSCCLQLHSNGLAKDLREDSDRNELLMMIHLGRRKISPLYHFSFFSVGLEDFTVENHLEKSYLFSAPKISCEGIKFSFNF